MVCVAWVFFRAESVGEAGQYLSAFAQEGVTRFRGLGAIPPIGILCADAIARGNTEKGPFSQFSPPLQSLIFVTISFLVFVCAISYKTNQFIYFQF